MIALFKRRYIVIGIVGALFAVSWFIYRQYRATSVTAKDKQDTSYTLKREPAKQTLTLSGKIDAEEKATLRFQTSGKLTWIGVHEGDTVKKFQAVASLDVRDVQKTLEKKLNTYLSTRWTFDQTNEDNEGTIPSDTIQRILDQSQFDLNNSVLDVEIQHLSLEYATLTTPIGGIVTNVDTPYAGVNITPAQATIDVINPESVYLSVSADQNEVAQLRTGMETAIVLDAFDEQTLVSTISAIGFTPKSGETGTVYEVKVPIPTQNTDYHLKIDMTADATFTTKEKENALLVPLSYVKQDNGKKYVFMNKNGKREKQYIETADEYDSRVEIASGLSEGDTVYD